MTQVKLTKNELRNQEIKRSQLKKYLPTLQLKKAMLQAEVNQIQMEIEEQEQVLSKKKENLFPSSKLVTDPKAADLFDSIEILDVRKRYENIAGVDCPIFESVEFAKRTYSLFDTPLWLDGIVAETKDVITVREIINVMGEKKAALEKELREVSIRVNLFEKIMIPRTEENIKKIKVFLGDQQLASVAQAKVAKQKIELRKQVAG